MKLYLAFFLLIAMFFGNLQAQTDAKTESEKLLIEGITQVALEQYATALEKLEAAYKLYPNNAMTIYWRGQAKQSLKDDQGALADFYKALEVDPAYPDALDKLGQIFADKQDFTTAISYFTKAIAAKSTDEDFYFHRGSAYFGLKDYAAANIDFSEAIKIKSDFSTAYFNRGICQYNLGNQVGACANWALASIYGYADAKNFSDKYCKSN